MKFEYETPTLEIDWFEADGDLAVFSPSKTTDFIPDTDSDDMFD